MRISSLILLDFELKLKTSPFAACLESSSSVRFALLYRVCVSRRWRAGIQSVRYFTLASSSPLALAGALLSMPLAALVLSGVRSPLLSSRLLCSFLFSYSLILSSLPTHSLSNAQHVSILSPLTSLSLPLLSSALLSSVLASVRVTSGTSSLLPPMHTRYARPVPAASSRIALRSPTPTLHANGTDAPIPPAFWHVMQCVPASPLAFPPACKLVSSFYSHSRIFAPSSCVIHSSPDFRFYQRISWQLPSRVAFSLWCPVLSSPLLSPVFALWIPQRKLCKACTIGAAQ